MWERLLLYSRRRHLIERDQNKIGNFIQQLSKNEYMMKNLDYPISNIENVHFSKGQLNQQMVKTNLLKNGYCIVRNTNLQNLFTAKRYDYYNTAWCFDPLHNVCEITPSHLKKYIFGDNYENEIMDYSHGTDKRPEYEKSILGVNDEVSPSNFINFHNELVYTDEFPKIISFVCITPSLTGGYTPISNVRAVYNELPNDIKEKLLKYGVKYVRNIRDKEAELNVKNNKIDIKGQKCWQDLFNTNDASEAESICRNIYNYDTQWLNCRTNNTPILRVMYNLPGLMNIQNDDNTVVTSFVNSLLGMHGSFFDSYDKYYETLPYMERPLHSLWGNGEEFTEEEIQTIKVLYQQNSIRFEWKAGDIIIIDNLWWAHGRYPFFGPRKILALMGIPWKRQENPLYVNATAFTPSTKNAEAVRSRFIAANCSKQCHKCDRANDLDEMVTIPSSCTTF
jgi:hypothetical protein